MNSIEISARTLRLRDHLLDIALIGARSPPHGDAVPLARPEEPRLQLRAGVRLQRGAVVRGGEQRRGAARRRSGRNVDTRRRGWRLL